MGAPRGPSDRDVERVLSGRPPADGADGNDAAAFLRYLRTLYHEDPAASVEAAHFAAIAREAGAENAGADSPPASPKPTPAPQGRRRGRPRTRLRLALVTVALAVAAPLGTAGLAVAGIPLPDLARAPFEELGIELPNQSAVDDVAKRVEEATPAAGGPTNAGGAARGIEAAGEARGSEPSPGVRSAASPSASLSQPLQPAPKEMPGSTPQIEPQRVTPGGGDARIGRQHSESGQDRSAAGRGQSKRRPESPTGSDGRSGLGPAIVKLRPEMRPRVERSSPGRQVRAQR